MTVSAVRWAFIDSLHARTGLQIPPLDFSRLGQNVEAFNLLIRIHYEHYQFYANMFVALGFAYLCYRVKLGGMAVWGWADAGFIGLELIFFCTSRDTLRLCLLNFSASCGEVHPHEYNRASGKLSNRLRRYTP